MTDIEALEQAIEALSLRSVALEPTARDWERYGSALQFGKQEAYASAQTIALYRQAIEVLRSLKTQRSRAAA